MSKVRASHHRNEKRETGVGKPVVAKALFFFGAAAFGSILQRAAPFEARTTWNLRCTRRDAAGGKADTVSIRYKTDGTFTCLSCSTHACSLNVLPYDLHVLVFIACVTLSCWRSRKETGKDILGKEPGKEPGSPGVTKASWEVTGVLYRGGVIKLMPLTHY